MSKEDVREKLRQRQEAVQSSQRKQPTGIRTDSRNQMPQQSALQNKMPQKSASKNISNAQSVSRNISNEQPTSGSKAKRQPFSIDMPRPQSVPKGREKVNKKHQKESGGEYLLKKAKERRKKERFLRIRMWVSFIASRLFMDRGTIPSNIGNNVFIGNNQMITKNSMAVMIQITNMSNEVPINFIGEVIAHLKRHAKNVKVDITIKTIPYRFDPNDRGLSSRVSSWSSVLDNPKVDEEAKKRAARLLYSVDILKAGNRAYSSYTYFILRSNNGHDLHNGIKECKSVLCKYKIGFKEIKDDIQLHLSYTLLMSNKYSDKMKDIPFALHTSRTLVEVMPTTQGMNDRKGILFGFDRMNWSPYYIDHTTSPGGKNVLVVGPSGRGKTFLVTKIAEDAHNSERINLVITDLKGNEFTELTKALGGTILSMSESNPYYINPYPLPKTLPYGRNSEEIFIQSIALGKEYLMIVINPSEDESPYAELIVDDFLSNLYLKIGVSERNINSWYRSNYLNPYVIAEEFEKWMGVEQKVRFGKLANKALDRVKSYMHRDSLHAGMWKYELDVDDIVDTSCLTFDYGMLDDKRSYDVTGFKLKFAQADYIKDVYIAKKSALGQYTLLIDEEGQLAVDYIAKSYKKDITLRRAQKCITFVLCNSVTSLLSEPAFNAVLGNIQIKIIGNVTTTDRNFLIREYGLDDYEYVLKQIAKDSTFFRTFLLINGFQPDAPTPLIEASVPTEKSSAQRFKE